MTSEKEIEKVTSERGRVSDSVLKPKIQEEETTYAFSPLESKLEIPKTCSALVLQTVPSWSSNVGFCNMYSFQAPNSIPSPSGHYKPNSSGIYWNLEALIKCLGNRSVGERICKIESIPAKNPPAVSDFLLVRWIKNRRDYRVQLYTGLRV